MSDREHNPEETAGAAKTLAVVAGVVLVMIAVPVGYFLYQINEFGKSLGNPSTKEERLARDQASAGCAAVPFLYRWRWGRFLRSAGVPEG